MWSISRGWRQPCQLFAPNPIPVTGSQCRIDIKPSQVGTTTSPGRAWGLGGSVSVKTKSPAMPGFFQRNASFGTDYSLPITSRTMILACSSAQGAEPDIWANEQPS